MSHAPRVDPTDLEGVVAVTPVVFRDERGTFTEVYNKSVFDAAIGMSVTFVQDNESTSSEGTVRGIHYQLDPAVQGKLIRVISGSVFDVAVDLRRSSESFGRWTGRHLSADEETQLWIPPGFGHGFLTTSRQCRVAYKVTAPYAPDLARVIRWDDPQLAIDWPLKGRVPILSPGDAAAPGLPDADVFA